MSVNIRSECERECSVTWNGWHGPDRQTPGTNGQPGDARCCEHGHIWAFERTTENRFYCLMDRWRRVSRFWEPLTYRRAVRAINFPAASEETTNAD